MTTTDRKTTDRKTIDRARMVALFVWAALLWVSRWGRRHWTWGLRWLLVAIPLSWLRSEPTMPWAAAGLVVPAVAVSWAFTAPMSYERFAAGPWRRRQWRKHLRSQWASLCDACGWSRRVVTGYEKDLTTRARREIHGTANPHLRSVKASGSVLTAVVRARRGQTVEDLEAGVPKLAASLDAVSVRAHPKPGSSSVLVVELVMGDVISRPVTASVPDSVDLASTVLPGEALVMGRIQTGGAWLLRIIDRHTLVVGCSGSGKGSILWSVVCGLAPWVPSDTVRLWGVDLKRGIELEMGRRLFSAYATTAESAVPLLSELVKVMQARGDAMAGNARQHTPRPGDPLHVLVIDELADLIAYAEVDERREATRLLKKILTQGRAVGVVVVACVQDPRKDVVSMRDLFTQRIALRLLSSEETHMVFGDSATRTAPAHRIGPQDKGMAWIVDDQGNADRVRADYWPDEVIRAVAATYPAAVKVTIPEPTPETTEPGPRSARAPRKPRAPRAPREATGEEGAEGAA